MVKLGKVYVLCGLPASGKSTLAKELSEKYDAVILSSDSIRKQLYGSESEQGSPIKVFEVLHYQVNSYLAKGMNVVMDATNVNRKRRIHLIKNEIRADEYICYYLNKLVDECVYNDSNRDRVVGKDVISRMYKSMQIPIKNEGWNEVIVHNSADPILETLRSRFEQVVNSGDKHNSLFKKLGNIIDEFIEITDLPHDSKYHTYSVSRHIYYTYKYVMDEYKGVRKFEMLTAALFHDIGKGYCKSFYNHKGVERDTASYIGHEFVSAQIAMNILYHLGYDEEFITYVTTLVQLHMIPHNMNDKQENKLRGLLSDEQYDDLIFLNDADLQAH